jgi:hypothetical protein
MNVETAVRMRTLRCRSAAVRDYQAALISGVTLYGGVFVGVLISERFKPRWSMPLYNASFLADLD